MLASAGGLEPPSPPRKSPAGLQLASMRGGSPNLFHLAGLKASPSRGTRGPFSIPMGRQQLTWPQPGRSRAPDKEDTVPALRVKKNACSHPDRKGREPGCRKVQATCCAGWRWKGRSGQFKAQRLLAVLGIQDLPLSIGQASPPSSGSIP